MRNEQDFNTTIMAASAATNIISCEQYDKMFASSGSESEDENSDNDISVSEESDSAEVSESESEDSAETADEDEPSWTVHISFCHDITKQKFERIYLVGCLLGKFNRNSCDRNCGWTSPRRNRRGRFVQTSVLWWYRWLHCCRNEAIHATEEKRERDIACNARRTKKRPMVVERKRRCTYCANILAFFSITANFNNNGTFLLNYFVYSKDSVKTKVICIFDVFAFVLSI